jgi:hypothetical protein
MAMSDSRKASSLFTFSVLGLGTVAAFLPAFLASRAIHKFCDGLTLGAPVAQVQARALASGLSYARLVDGTSVVEHPRSLGRPYCELRFDDKGQLASKSADN